MSVAAFHAYGNRPDDGAFGLLSRGEIGVTIFFVISGYCIAAAVEATLGRGHHVGQFAWRRWRRIFPPYLILLAATALVVTLTPNTFGETRWGLEGITIPWSIDQWIGNATLTEGWRARLMGPTGSHWLVGHAWTLGYEEQFYVMMALLLTTCGRHWWRGVIVITAGTVAAVMFLPPLKGVFVDGNWLLFACGVFVFRYRQRPSLTLMAALVTAMVWSRLQPVEAIVLRKVWYSAGYALLLIGLLRWDFRIASARALRPLAWCGVRCYSIYLVHWPVVKAVEGELSHRLPPSLAMAALVITPIAVAASVIVAIPFHRWIEQPFLNRPPNRRDRRRKTSGLEQPRLQRTT